MAVNEHGGSPGPDEADERIARLYKEASREEPPARLDRLIAAAARERGAVAPAARPPWWLPWRVPFAFAAVAIVSVSLVTLMVDADRERITALPSAAPPPAAREAPAAPVESDALERESNVAGKPAAVPRRKDAPQPRPSAPRERMAQVEQPVEAGRREAAPAATADARSQRSMPEPPRETMQDAARDASARVPAEPQSFPAGERAAAAPPAPVSAPSGMAGRAAEATSAPQPAVKPAPAAKARMRGFDEQAALGAARPAPEVARHLTELDRQPLAAWIDRVMALRKDGRMAEADGVLAELKRRYPEAALPLELR